MEVSGRSGVTGLASSHGVRRMASLRSPAGQQQKHGGRPKWTTIVMATTGPSSSMSSLSSNVVPLSRYRKSYGRAYIQCWYLYKSGGPLDGVGHEGRHKAKKNVHRERLMVHAMSSSFGRCFRVTTFGESHGSGVGCVVDGCPPALSISRVDIQQELDRRRPGQSRITTPRKEADACEILSGVDFSNCTEDAEEGITLGTPIAILVRNKDQRSGDYSEMDVAYRPSHADMTYDAKYGVRAVAGGGRSSARETIGRVAAGAIAKKLLHQSCGCDIIAYVSQVRDVILPPLSDTQMHELSISEVESNIARCPDESVAEKMIKAIDEVRVRGESCGGALTLVCRNVPAGLGDPVFEKLEARLSSAMMSLPASKGVEIGSGFSGASQLGSEHNDEFYLYNDGNGTNRIRTKTNRSGGIQGGISNGEDIVMRVAFKPTSTIGIKQHTVTRDGKETILRARGRHDPCVLPRAVPMVESMAALVLADALMTNHAQNGLLNGYSFAKEVHGNRISAPQDVRVESGVKEEKIRKDIYTEE